MGTLFGARFSLSAASSRCACPVGRGRARAPGGGAALQALGGDAGPAGEPPPSLWLTMSVATAVLPSLSQACQTSVLSVRLAPGGMTGNCP